MNTMAADQSSETSPVSVDEVADELYGLPLDEFTAVRNERAKQAREAGDRQASEAIRALAKPSAVAWLANQLVRHRHDEIDPLVELGASLREATASLDADQLRALSKQQHQVIYALTQQARQLASEAGQPVSDATARGLEQTLHAALADENAARALSSGRLTSTLDSSGFPGVDGVAAGQAVLAPQLERARRPAAEKTDPAELARRQRERAEQDVADARAAAQQADAERDEANRRLQASDDTTKAAADEVERLRQALDDAMTARANAERDERQARKDAERADRAARTAQRRLSDAQARLRDLPG